MNALIVRLGVAKYTDLPAVIVLGFGNAHRVVDLVAVAARSDIGRDHDGCLCTLVAVAQIRHKRYGSAIRLGELRARITELRAPIGARPPRRAFEHESGAVAFCDRDVAFVVRADGFGAARALQQVEAREIRELDAVVKNQCGLKAAVGEKRTAGQLREPTAIFRHMHPFAGVSPDTYRARDVSVSKLAVKRAHYFLRDFLAG